MKTLKQPLSTLVVLILGLLPVTADHADAEKPGLAHLSIREKMANTGVLPDASGRVDLKLSKAGKDGKEADQRLELKLEHLEANAAYQLVAGGDDTNTFEVVEFTSNHEGKARLEFRSNEKKTKSKPGEVKAGLPEELKPIVKVGTLAIVDATGQTVLSADLNTLDKLHFAFKRYLRSGDIKAKVYLKANKNKGQVKLHADELNPGSTYSLSLNGNIVATGAANYKGKLDLRADLVDPLEVLNLEIVEVLDDGGNVVLSTSVP
jgi:hypothetical protein